MKELQNITILFADDDPIMRASLGNSLSLLSKQVLLASNGLEALRLYKEHTIQIIILDIAMPGKNGLEVAAEIRKIDRNIPIVILTAYEDTPHLHQAIKLHLVDYLVKPIDFKALMSVLSDCLGHLREQGLLSVKIDDTMIYNCVEKMFIKGEEKITLTKNEVILVELMLKHRGSMVSYETIAHELNHPSKDAVKNALLRLRKKIGPSYIKNMFDLGYQFV